MWQRWDMDEPDNHPRGLRERKRQDTAERIAEASLRLFLAKGYEHTTLEEIAEAAGISRRTFFYYYKSKDDILVALQCEGFVRAMAGAFGERDREAGPFAAVARVLPELAAAFETPETKLITDILKSTEALRVRKQAGYVEMETALLEAMAGVWPEAEMRLALALVATAGISVLRLGIDRWYEEGAVRPISEYLREGFGLLSETVGH